MDALNTSCPLTTTIVALTDALGKRYNHEIQVYEFIEMRHVRI